MVFIPDTMALDPYSFRELLEERDERFILCDNVLAFHTTVVDLGLAWIALLEYARHDALPNNALAKVIHDYSAWEKEARNIELVDSANTDHILSGRYAGSLVTAICGECAYSISSEREKHTVMNIDLSVSAFCGIQRRYFASCHQHCPS